MTKVLAVFLFLKVRVTKVIRKKGTNEVHPNIYTVIVFFLNFFITNE
jgi:hypothetical protein